MIRLSRWFEAEPRGDALVAFGREGERSRARSAARRRRARGAARARRADRDLLLHCDDAYAFAVGLLATASAGARAVLPPSRQPGTLRELAQKVHGALLRRRSRPTRSPICRAGTRSRIRARATPPTRSRSGSTATRRSRCCSRRAPRARGGASRRRCAISRTRSRCSKSASARSSAPTRGSSPPWRRSTSTACYSACCGRSRAGARSCAARCCTPRSSRPIRAATRRSRS